MWKFSFNRLILIFTAIGFEVFSGSIKSYLLPTKTIHLISNYELHVIWFHPTNTGMAKNSRNLPAFCTSLIQVGSKICRFNEC